MLQSGTVARCLQMLLLQRCRVVPPVQHSSGQGAGSRQAASSKVGRWRSIVGCASCGSITVGGLYAMQADKPCRSCNSLAASLAVAAPLLLLLLGAACTAGCRRSGSASKRCSLIALLLPVIRERNK